MKYEIKVKGIMPSYRFEAFEHIYTNDYKTLLRGELIDQSALYGVLRKIQDFGIELIELRLIEEEV